MAFTYNEPTTDLWKVRWEIGDTTKSIGILTDEEVQYALDEEGSVDGAVVRILTMFKSMHSHRGEADRVSGIDEAIDAHTTASMPEVQVTFPAHLPMDAGYDPSDP